MRSFVLATFIFALLQVGAPVLAAPVGAKTPDVGKLCAPPGGKECTPAHNNNIEIIARSVQAPAAPAPPAPPAPPALPAASHGLPVVPEVVKALSGVLGGVSNALGGLSDALAKPPALPVKPPVRRSVHAGPLEVPPKPPVRRSVHAGPLEVSPKHQGIKRVEYPSVAEVKPAVNATGTAAPHAKVLNNGSKVPTETTNKRPTTMVERVVASAPMDVAKVEVS